MKNIWEDRNFSPMLLFEYEKPFNSSDYLFEVKFDGVRALIFVNRNNIYIQSRNKKNLTSLFPEFCSIKNLVKNNVIFDGEIVSFKDGKPSFSELAKRIRVKNKFRIISLSEEEPVVFVVFDILYEDKDLTKLPLVDRKRILDKYRENENFIKSKVIDYEGVKLFNSVKKLGLEGIVAKYKNGIYHINKRTDDFIKIKNIKSEEFFVGGYELKKNDILSLAIGEYVDEKFHFVGKVSIGKKVNIYEKVLKSRESKNYFCDFSEDIFYVKPTLKCTVEYLERTKNGHLRHPVFRNG